MRNNRIACGELIVVVTGAMGIYFDSSKLPNAKPEYVIWCDGMGTGTLLTRSLDGAANSVFRTHVAFERMRAKVPSVKLYPVMDGLYATTPNRRDARVLLQGVFTQIARQFLNEPVPHHRTIIRAAIAFGPCIHGDQVPPAAFGTEPPNEIVPSARNAILLSPAMPLAHDAERLAAPFGVAIDPTATSMPIVVNGSDKGFNEFVFRWWEGLNNGDHLNSIVELREKVLGHLKWVEQNAAVVGYPSDSAKKHQKLAEDYLPTKENITLMLEKLASEGGTGSADLGKK